MYSNTSNTTGLPQDSQTTLDATTGCQSRTTPRLRLSCPASCTSSVGRYRKTTPGPKLVSIQVPNAPEAEKHKGRQGTKRTEEMKGI